MPSAPGAPLLIPHLNARPKFSGESIRPHNETSGPKMTAPSSCADLPLRSAAVLNGNHRLLARAHVRGMAAINATGASNTDSSV